MPEAVGEHEWARRTVAPFYRSGAAAVEGAALLAALPLPTVPRWSPGALRIAAADAAGERTIVTVLDSYNRSNAMNLVALTALTLQLRHPVAPAAAPAGALAGPPAVEGRMPALPYALSQPYSQARNGL